MKTKKITMLTIALIMAFILTACSVKTGKNGDNTNPSGADETNIVGYYQLVSATTDIDNFDKLDVPQSQCVYAFLRAVHVGITNPELLENPEFGMFLWSDKAVSIMGQSGTSVIYDKEIVLTLNDSNNQYGVDVVGGISDSLITLLYEDKDNDIKCTLIYKKDNNWVVETPENIVSNSYTLMRIEDSVKETITGGRDTGVETEEEYNEAIIKKYSDQPGIELINLNDGMGSWLIREEVTYIGAELNKYIDDCGYKELPALRACSRSIQRRSNVI